MAIKDYSGTAADNIAISGISITGLADVKNFDNAMRQQLADIANWTDSDTLASATTTDLGSVEGMYVTVTGTTTITAFGTLKAGMVKVVKFSGVLTINHNATSMILPGATNIGTTAGDTAVFVSEGSGNWRCVAYQIAAYVAPIMTPWVKYTPTFVGVVPTVSGEFVYSRRVGGSLEVIGQVTASTSSTDVMTMTLGFGGTNGGLAVSSILSGRYVVGNAAVGFFSESSYTVLAEASNSVVKFGIQSATRAGTVPAEGNAVLGASDILMFRFSVPIAGWQ